MGNVTQIVSNGLCLGCGTCESACVKNAIQMEVNTKYSIYCPAVNVSACNNCGICIKVCPGKGFDSILCKDGNVEYCKELGPYINCYIGHSTNPEIMRQAASGGLITSILTCMLENQKIESALISKSITPCKAAPVIVNSVDEIMKSSGSLYCPVCTVAKAKETQGKFAMVGLPCHTYGINKINSILKKNKPELIIGLFCGYGRSFLSTESILRRLHITSNQVEELQYRSGDWPGNFEVSLRNGPICKIPYKKAYTNFYAPFSCTFCTDATAELADISCGDAWIVKDKYPLGATIVITRTKKGEEYLQEAFQKKCIILEKIDFNLVIQSQQRAIIRKKRKVILHKKLAQLFNKPYPNNNAELIKPLNKDLFDAIIMYLAMFIARIPVFERIFDIYLNVKAKRQ